jgi:hypothetical protein
MGEPNWHGVAALAWTAEAAAWVEALGIEIPPEGRPRQFSASPSCLASWELEKGQPRTMTVWRRPSLAEGEWETDRSQTLGPSWQEIQEGRAVQAMGDLAVQYFRLPPGTPTGDALRSWLKLWGWEPPPKHLKVVAPPPMVL